MIFCFLVSFLQQHQLFRKGKEKLYKYIVEMFDFFSVSKSG